MNTLAQVESAPARPGKASQGVFGMIRSLVSEMRRREMYTDASSRLGRLSRRELADIGVEDSAGAFAWQLATDRSTR